MWISFGYCFTSFLWVLLSSLFCVDKLSLFLQGHTPILNDFRAGKCDEILRHGDGSARGEMKKLVNSFN